jgi:Cu/Ag efflux pump CusA
MLATGIKVAGPNRAELERIASEVEAVVKGVPGTLSAFAGDQDYQDQ